MSRLGSRSEAGGIAVVSALVALVLIGFCAFAMDFGNAFARKRHTQFQADFAALAGAQELGVGNTKSTSDPAVKAVAEYLIANQPNDDNGGTPSTSAAMAAALVDGAVDNGEVFFTDNEMRVQVPRVFVGYGLAGVFGADGVDVQASATVRLESILPPGSKIFPFAMPDQCPFGPAMADARPRGQNKADTSGTYSPTPAREGSVQSISPTTLDGAANSPVLQVVLSGLKKNTSLADVTILFQAGAATSSVSPTSWAPAGPTANNGDSRTVATSVPQEVLDTPGTWNVWGVIGNKNTGNSQPLVVNEASDANEVSCTNPGSGQFGQMYSPRGNQAPDQRGFALNIALGLDHDLLPWPNASQPECGKKNAAPPAGGVQDKPSPPSRPNCVLPQTGNDGPWMLKGLISGVDGVPGRLDVTNPQGRRTKSGCGPGDVSREGVIINNDRLSCYLLSGTLGDLAKESTDPADFEGLLDPDVVNSPRFVWIPVIHAVQRADIDNNTFYALKRFVPGFLTDETASTSASSDNGVFISGQLDGLQLYMFNALSLPADERSPSGPLDPYMPPVIRLVD